MQASELTIRLIVLLIPGLIAALAIEILTIHKEWNQFRFVLYDILLSFASYELLIPFGIRTILNPLWPSLPYFDWLFFQGRVASHTILSVIELLYERP